MRNLSDMIAQSRRDPDDKPMNPLVMAVFVVVLLTSAAGVAYWIGSSIAAQSAGPTVMADLEY